MHLNELKSKNPSDLLLYAESLDVENASNLRKQDMMFACLKKLAENDVSIYGEGVLEVLADGFGLLDLTIYTSHLVRLRSLVLELVTR